MILPCKGFLTSLLLFVFAIPGFCTITHTGNPTVAGCADQFTTDVSGTNYQWDFGPNSYPRRASGASPTAPTSFLTPGSHTVTVTVTTGGGPVVESLTINVQANPTTATLTANRPLCRNVTVTYTASAPGATVYAFFVKDSAMQVGLSNTFARNVEYQDSIRVFALVGTCYVTGPTLYESSPEAPVLSSDMPVGDTICSGDRIIFTITPSGPFDSVAYYVGGSWQQGSRTLTTWTTTTRNEGNVVYAYVMRNGCASYYPTNSITVHVKPTPQMGLSATDSIICQGTPVTFTGSVLQTTVTDSFTFWINSARVQSGTNSNNTFTTSSLNNRDTVVVTGSLNGCRSAASNAIIMTVSSAPPVTLTSSDANDSICQGTPVTFTAAPATYNNYQFFDGSVSVQNSASATFTTTALTSGNSISVVATSSGCPPQTSNSITTVVTPAPVVDAGAPTRSACIYAAQDTLTGFTPTGGTWTGTGITDATNGYFDPATAGAGAHTLTYSYTEVNSGCAGTDNVVYTVTARPNVTINPVNPAVCTGQDIVITAIGASTYQWAADPTLSDATIANPTATPTATTTYTVTGTDVNNCSNTASATVSVNQVTPLDFTFQAGCSGQATSFSLSDPAPPNTTFTWYFGDGNTSNLPGPTHVYTSGNTYTVLLITQQGICADTSTQTVLVYPGADANFEATPTTSYVGDPIRFTNNSAGADNYEWDLGDQTTSDVQSFTHTYDEAGVYTVKLTVSNNAGCADSVIKLNYITIFRKPKIFIPNAFTPGNTDNNNDVLHVFGDGLKYMDWKIYNRIGEKVFDSNNISSEPGVGWDGTYKGAIVPQGVYSYTMDVVFDDNTRRQYKGSITVLR